MSLFADRRQAGRTLADALSKYLGRDDLFVLGLPRGGVPVAYEVAHFLGAPLDVLVVRKLGVAGHEELAMGALAAGGLHVIDQDVVKANGISRDEVRRAIHAEQPEISRRERAYRDGRAPLDLSGRTVILVDDGLATGSTMRVSVLTVRQQHPLRVVTAVPVAPEETCLALSEVADDVVCAVTPQHFYAVGLWYRDFSQTDDEEIRELLETSRREYASTI